MDLSEIAALVLPAGPAWSHRLLAMPDSSRAIASIPIVVALVAVYLIWGSTYLGVRVAFTTAAAPPVRRALRLAGILLYAWLRIRGGPRPTAAHWLSGGVIGTLLMRAARPPPIHFASSHRPHRDCLRLGSFVVAPPRRFFWGERASARMARPRARIGRARILNAKSELRAHSLATIVLWAGSSRGHWARSWGATASLPHGGMGAPFQMMVGGLSSSSWRSSWAIAFR